MSADVEQKAHIGQIPEPANRQAGNQSVWLPLYVCACLGSLLAGVLVLHDLIQAPVDWFQVWALHGLSVVLNAGLTVWVWRHGLLDEDGRDARVVWFATLNVLVATMGALGAFVCLAGLASHRFFITSAQPFDVWYTELFPEEQHDLAENLYADLTRTLHRLSGPQDVVPFIDVIRHGNQLQKQLTIGLMSRHYRREFSTALKEALADPDNSVRIQAATAIANIENRFYSQLQSLREQAEKDPAAQNLLALARQYDEYAFTGLLDGERERRNREEALTGYRRYLAIQPNDVRAYMALVRLLVKMDRAQEALATIDAAPPDVAGANDLAAWKMEALFKLRRFDAIRGIAAKLVNEERSDMPMPGVLSDSVRLWAGSTSLPVDPVTSMSNPPPSSSAAVQS